MNPMSPQSSKPRRWLYPLIHLSNNSLSFLGVALVTTSTILWLFLLPASWAGEAAHPYLGLLTFLVLPAGFFGGLALIPIGLYLRARRERRRGGLPAVLPSLDFRNPQLRRLLTFVGVVTFANVMIGSQLTYRAVTYMDSNAFCGQACHTVMQPEYTAYQNSPHARVGCVQCHIGAGASWFVRSKLSGVRQVFAVALDTYSRPIPAPVEDLRPARETCETCHWPQKFGGNRLRTFSRFAADESNTLTKTVLLMRIGGGNGGGGIHGAHFGEGIVIRYRHTDRQRQNIPWVEYSRPNSPPVVYTADGTSEDDMENAHLREMDCMDCHNRPTHIFEAPGRALDAALTDGSISPRLPFVKKKGLQLLERTYPTHDEAARQIAAELESYYRSEHPQALSANPEAVRQAARTLSSIYQRNVFPQMNVTWGSYPNNIGHTDFPGCFRCHDAGHTTTDGRTIGQDCFSCHHMLAVDEPSPQILSDLGLADGS